MKKSLISKIFTVLLVSVLLTGSWFGRGPVQSTFVQVIVEGTDVAVAGAAVQAVGGRVIATIDIIDAVVAQISPTAQQHLAQMPGIVRVTPDRQVMAAGQGKMPNVEFVKTIGVDEVWAAGNLGAGVTIAFLDSGLDTTFADLKHPTSGNADRVLAYYDVASDRVFTPPQLNRAPGDPNGHGTHVAGIVANRFYENQDAEFRGVAPAANLVAVRVLDETGVGSYANVLKGINWIVQNKDVYNIRVLNISMYAVPVAPYWADPYNRAVMAAWQAGIVVVTSAGNTGPDPLSIGVPGNTPYVITVGAFTDNRTPSDYSDDYMPSFSAAGPTLDAFVKPDVIAPGAHVESLMRTNSYLSRQYPDRRLNGHYFEMSGTSMSTAVVSGIVALMLSEDPTLTPDQVKFRLMQTARPQFAEGMGEAAYSIWQQGAGRVWAADAVFTDIPGVANRGMDIAADLAGTVHYQGWTTFDPETNEFKILGGGYESWADGYTTWSGGYTSWADGYESWADVTNWSGGFTSWADGFTSWADGFTSWADGFTSWADGFTSWADGFTSWADLCMTDDGYTSWADGFTSWADGFTSWADGFTSWADGYTSWADGFTSWADGFTSWADGFTSWADSFTSWADGYTSWADALCQSSVDGFTSWADGFTSWADGFTSWADGIAVWSGASGVWAGGYTSWADGFTSWADGFTSWADGYTSWADGFTSWADACGIPVSDYTSWLDGFTSWADGYTSWADGFTSWADGFTSWADFVVWMEGFTSWADGFTSWADSFVAWASVQSASSPLCTPWLDGFTSWADGFTSWADGYTSWADGYTSWADGFTSWADGFNSWADGLPSWTSALAVWNGGYATWAGGYQSWADGFTSWADNVGDPAWAAAFYNLNNLPTNTTTVNVNLWIGDEE